MRDLKLKSQKISNNYWLIFEVNVGKYNSGKVTSSILLCLLCVLKAMVAKKSPGKHF